jgi:hypothetical protein
MGNERGVLTDDVQAVDWGRWRDFDLARRSGTVILGYRREGGGGVAPSLGLQRLSCDLHGGNKGIRRPAPRKNTAMRHKALTDGSSSKKSVTPRRAGMATQAWRWRELGDASITALGITDEIDERQLGGAVTSTYARQTDGEAVSYDSGWCGGERWCLPWR